MHIFTFICKILPDMCLPSKVLLTKGVLICHWSKHLNVLFRNIKNCYKAFPRTNYLMNTKQSQFFCALNPKLLFFWGGLGGGEGGAHRRGILVSKHLLLNRRIITFAAVRGIGSLYLENSYCNYFLKCFIITQQHCTLQSCFHAKHQFGHAQILQEWKQACIFL